MESIEGFYQNEKKWHLSGEGGYSGPFSDAEMISLIESGKIRSNHLVWSSDSEDWVPVSSIPQFEVALYVQQVTAVVPAPEPVPPAATENAASNEDWMGSEEFWQEVSRHYRFQSEEFADLNRSSPAPAAAPVPLVTPEAVPAASPSRRAAIQQRVSLSFFAGLAVSAALACLLTLHWSSPSLDIPDVSRDEKREIEAAIAESETTMGPSAAVALEQRNGEPPAIVIGSNRPDGDSLEIRIEGVPDTLVGAFRLSIQAPLVLRHGLARSPPLLQNGTRPLPTGEYQVSVLCAACGAGRSGAPAVLARKKYFLGTRDQAYELKLRQYHEALRQKARGELIEAKQLSETLERELSEAAADFEQVLNAGSEGRRRWTEASRKWLEMDSQLGEIVERWNLLNSHGEVLYSSIFSLLRETRQRVVKVHAMQDQYGAIASISSEQELSQLGGAIASDTALAQSGLFALKTQIVAAEKAPLSANGMPRTQ